MKSKYVFWLIAAIAALAIFISCARPRSPKEKQIPETDTIEQVVAPTVQEVLQWRESMRLDKYVDSVFLVMPEQVLTQILVTKGTDLSNHEIASINEYQQYAFDHIKDALTQEEKDWYLNNLYKVTSVCEDRSNRFYCENQ